MSKHNIAISYACCTPAAHVAILCLSYLDNAGNYVCQVVRACLQGESAAMQAGVQVTQEQEQLVLDALMQQQPANAANIAAARLEHCGNADNWGSGLRTEHITHVHQQHSQGASMQSVPHRLYVQVAPGEMRLATVMLSEP